MNASQAKDPVRAVIVGLGTHGRSIVGAGVEAGVHFVAAVDPFQASKDLGELTGVELAAGVTVAESADALDWASLQADIAIVAIKAPPANVVALMQDLLRKNLDVVTIVEDIYDLRLIDPELHAQLDQTAREHGKTAVATGSQDIAWVGLTTAATGLVRDLKYVELKQHLGVDGYPEDFVRWVGIGCTETEWQEAAENAGRTPSVFGGILPTMARSMGLTPGTGNRDMSIFTLDHDVESETFGRTIKAGDPAGRRDLVTLDTLEGVRFSAELITSVVMDQDDFSAAVQGEHRVEINHKLLPGPPSVDATLINRLPDVIAAPPGVIATTKLPLPRYRQTVRNFAKEDKEAVV